MQSCVTSVSLADIPYRNGMTVDECDRYIVANAIASIMRVEKSDLPFDVFVEELVNRYGGDLAIVVCDWVRNYF